MTDNACAEVMIPILSSGDTYKPTPTIIMEGLTMHNIHQRLLEQPGLSKAIRMETAMRFVWLAASLKQDIVHAQGQADDPTVPPPSLPHNIHTFMGSAVYFSDGFVTGCWKGFKGTIWSYEAKSHSGMADSLLFYKHGKDHHLGMSIQSEWPLTPIHLDSLSCTLSTHHMLQ